MKQLNLVVFITLCIALFSCSKKSNDGSEIPAPTPIPGTPSTAFKSEHGAPIGAIVTATIGAAGGAIQTPDGNIKLTIPAGAVSANTNFSIQQVENKFGSKSPAYRLLPEGQIFEKDITIDYSYASMNYTAAQSKLIFMSYQDKDGYYHKAKSIVNNFADKRIKVSTKHFSDWMIYTQIELKPNRELKNGNVYMREDEEVQFQLESRTGIADKSDPLADQLVLITQQNYIIASAKWALAPSIGTLQPNPGGGYATVRAPKKFQQQHQDITLSVTLTGDLGTDNEGNKMGQLILLQNLVYESDELFEVTVDGQTHEVKDWTIEDNGIGYVIGGWVGTDAFTFQSTIHGTGSQGFGELDKGKAFANYLLQTGLSFISFKHIDCANGVGTTHSEGHVSLTRVARQVNEYFEGSFSASLFSVGFCENGKTKGITGRFRVRKLR